MANETADANSQARTAETATSRPLHSERDEIMRCLAERISFIDDRIETLMAADDTAESVLIRWIHTQGYLAGQYRKLMKDIDIDEMQDDLELLKDITNVGEDR